MQSKDRVILAYFPAPDRLHGFATRSR